MKLDERRKLDRRSGFPHSECCTCSPTDDPKRKLGMSFSGKDFFVLMLILASWVAVGIFLVVYQPPKKAYKIPSNKPFEPIIKKIIKTTQLDSTLSKEIDLSEVEVGDPDFYDEEEALNEETAKEEGSQKNEASKEPQKNLANELTEEAKLERQKIMVVNELIKFPPLGSSNKTKLGISVGSNENRKVNDAALKHLRKEDLNEIDKTQE